MTIHSWEHRYDAHPLVRAIRLERAILRHWNPSSMWMTLNTRHRWQGMMRRALSELGPRPTP